MFRIVQIEVDDESIVDAYHNDHSKLRVERISKLMRPTNSMLGDGRVFTSRPMTTTSVEYFEIESCLRSLFGDSQPAGVCWNREVGAKWRVCDHTDKYQLIRTTAPQAYDYGYVIEIGQMEGERGIERLVAMPRENVEYQTGRYMSGLYTAVDCS